MNSNVLVRYVVILGVLVLLIHGNKAITAKELKTIGKAKQPYQYAAPTVQRVPNQGRFIQGGRQNKNWIIYSRLPSVANVEHVIDPTDTETRRFMNSKTSILISNLPKRTFTQESGYGFRKYVPSTKTAYKRKFTKKQHTLAKRYSRRTREGCTKTKRHSRHASRLLYSRKSKRIIYTLRPKSRYSKLFGFTRRYFTKRFHSRPKPTNYSTKKYRFRTYSKRKYRPYSTLIKNSRAQARRSFAPRRRRSILIVNSGFTRGTYRRDQAKRNPTRMWGSKATHTKKRITRQYNRKSRKTKRIEKRTRKPNGRTHGKRTKIYTRERKTGYTRRFIRYTRTKRKMKSLTSKIKNKTPNKNRVRTWTLRTLRRRATSAKKRKTGYTKFKNINTLASSHSKNRTILKRTLKCPRKVVSKLKGYTKQTVKNPRSGFTRGIRKNTNRRPSRISGATFAPKQTRTYRVKPKSKKIKLRYENFGVKRQEKKIDRENVPIIDPRDFKRRLKSGIKSSKKEKNTYKSQQGASDVLKTIPQTRDLRFRGGNLFASKIDSTRRQFNKMDRKNVEDNKSDNPLTETFINEHAQKLRMKVEKNTSNRVGKPLYDENQLDRYKWVSRFTKAVNHAHIHSKTKNHSEEIRRVRRNLFESTDYPMSDYNGMMYTVKSPEAATGHVDGHENESRLDSLQLQP